MIPQQLLSLSYSLAKNQWINDLLDIGDVYLVGGSVRDAFLNKPIKDVDLMVEGVTLEDIKEVLFDLGKVDIVGESFSVIKFSPTGYKGEPYDIATPRIDKKVGTGHKGFEIITDGVSIDEDLKRRDFTINSIAFDLRKNELVDPYGGIQDLEKELLRATDSRAFIEDPLRIIRGIQFSARFGFDIESHTLKLMKQNAHLVKQISGERIFEELQKIISKGGSTQRALDLIHETGVDKALFDKKMLPYEELDELDSISFYYVLAILGDVKPREFVKHKLKGDSRLEKAVDALDTLLLKLSELSEEEDIRYITFKIINKVPEIADVVILPPQVVDVLNKMENEEIPSIIEEIPISGDDIIQSGVKQGPEVGIIKEKIIRDALMNRFDWKDKDDSIEYLSGLLS